ncbi:MAG TPA: hypothetical protein VGN88_13075, partial [Phycisphaerae bacterium]
MASSDSPVMEIQATLGAVVTQEDRASSPSIGWLRLLISSVLVYFLPWESRIWPQAKMFRAAVVAIVNTIFGFLWTYLALVVSYVWIYPSDGDAHLGVADTAKAMWHGAIYRDAARHLANDWAEQWKAGNLFDKLGFFVGVAFFIVAAYLLPYFVLLPFGARPSTNKSCARHVARITLLGSGLVHLWGAGCVLIFLGCVAAQIPPLTTTGDNYAGAVSPLLVGFSVLSLWSLLVLVHAVRREYRRAGDYPTPHEPWCDVCGYNLSGLNGEGRCPECGRLIQDSVGPHVRPPTAWETRPSIFNIPVIVRQITTLVVHPRKLFYAMPTLTGQRAAQRWLIFSSCFIFMMALGIVPALYKTLGAEWNSVVVTGSLAMGIVWTVFALMMVGIETAGIAAFSRMRGLKVYLSTSSKVTCYSSILIFLWVILGGIQLITYTYLSVPPHSIRQLFHVGLRGEQIVLGVSLGIAHIGG